MLGKKIFISLLNQCSVSALALLFFVCFLLITPARVNAGDFCSEEPYFGVVDGDVLPSSPIQVTIDTDCTFQNWPESNPLTTTINFQTNDPSIYLIIFDNVIYTGNMACANIDHRIWFSNGSYYGSNNSCQDLFIPVETIDKRNPEDQTIAAIGVPFTYTFTLPSMQFTGDPSVNDLHSISIIDDLTATGADLTYVSHNAYLKGSGTPVTLDFTNPDNKHLTFEYDLLRAGDQIVLELTVVLDDSVTNVSGTQFINTAKWWFGRLIDGVFYQPLPGEWGITQPMTIGEPDLVVTKTSDTTALNLIDTANFTIDVQNIGGSSAWNTAVLDRLPDIPGVTDMCPNTAPSITAEIFEADGVTSVSGPLVEGNTEDFLVTYDSSTCELGITMLDSPSGAIGPSQHLSITYQAQLDPDTDPGADGVTLTNVAGATRWYSGDSSIGGRRTYGGGPGSLTNGTPGVLDFQDSETITTALSGYFFQKTVSNLTSGDDPALYAVPGDILRYRLRLFNITEVINGIIISDPLDPDLYDLSSFTMVSDIPSMGASYNFNAVSGLLQVQGSPDALDLIPPDELVIEFDIALRSDLDNDISVANQAVLQANSGTLSTLSDDPYVNGIASPGDDADPTTVVIQAPGALLKSNTQASATIGEQFHYRITIQPPVSICRYTMSGFWMT